MKFYISIFYCLFFSISAQADNFQSIDSIKTEIEAHFKANTPEYHWEDIDIRVENIDPRLQLKECSQNGLQVFNPYSTPLLQTNTIGLRCVDPQAHWTLYIPISINWYKEVVVAKTSIPPGKALSSSLLRLEKMNVNQLRHGYFTDSKELDGQVSKYRLNAGSVIHPSVITTEKIIKRGQQVDIEAKSAGFSVRMQGEAMNDGYLGDVIRVKNSTSKRIIQARVIGSHSVRVNV
ncbi:MAG: flagellar basal body P-ring formation protein FlgA [Legionellaceae bacterium]|nr:flagellar basal body P-ring formation protein FlgA [Legionellaceae bacterium]